MAGISCQHTASRSCAINVHIREAYVAHTATEYSEHAAIPAALATEVVYHVVLTVEVNPVHIALVTHDILCQIERSPVGDGAHVDVIVHHNVIHASGLDSLMQIHHIEE